MTARSHSGIASSSPRATNVSGLPLRRRWPSRRSTGWIRSIYAVRVRTRASRMARIVRSSRRSSEVRCACREAPELTRQRPRVSAIRLHSPRPLGVHGRIVRVGDDDLMARLFQAARHPFTSVDASTRILAFDRRNISTRRWRCVRIRRSISYHRPSESQSDFPICPDRCQHGPRLASPAALTAFGCGTLDATTLWGS
jgi:hypothetical protein